MKTNRKGLINQRGLIEKKLGPWTLLRTDKVPPSGWIKAVRGALGMTSRQLAERVGVKQSNITRLEEREPSGKVTLELLARAAKAMNCKLVYAVVPDDRYADLETIVDDQARALAQQLVRRTEHSMRLEKQGVDAADLARQAQSLADDLKSKMDSRIWSQKTASENHRKEK